MRTERDIKPTIHVLPFKNGDWKVYVGNSLTAKRVFHDYDTTMTYAKELQKKKRIPISIHLKNGLVVQTIVPSEARCLKPIIKNKKET